MGPPPQIHDDPNSVLFWTQAAIYFRGAKPNGRGASWGPAGNHVA